jgi:hypothetical protein
MKKTIYLLGIFFLSVNCFSQKKIIDFLVTKKGDTIYGNIRKHQTFIKFNLYYSTNPNINSMELMEENKDISKKKIYFSHKLKNSKCFSYRGRIYNYDEAIIDDGIYENDNIIDTLNISYRIGDYVHKISRKNDYIINNNNDTIFGNINKPLFAKLALENLNEKIKIDKDEVISYRYENDIFKLKYKPRVDLFDKKKAYLRLLIDGKIKLYDYNYKPYKTVDDKGKRNNSFYEMEYYFIEKNGEVIFINPIMFSKKVREIFFDNDDIISKLNNKYFVYEDLYAIVKLYNYVK